MNEDFADITSLARKAGTTGTPGLHRPILSSFADQIPIDKSKRPVRYALATPKFAGLAARSAEPSFIACPRLAAPLELPSFPPRAFANANAALVFLQLASRSACAESAMIPTARTLVPACPRPGTEPGCPAGRGGRQRSAKDGPVSKSPASQVSGLDAPESNHRGGSAATATLRGSDCRQAADLCDQGC